MPTHQPPIDRPPYAEVDIHFYLYLNKVKCSSSRYITYNSKQTCWVSGWVWCNKLPPLLLGLPNRLGSAPAVCPYISIVDQGDGATALGWDCRLTVHTDCQILSNEFCSLMESLISRRPHADGKTEFYQSCYAETLLVLFICQVAERVGRRHILRMTFYPRVRSQDEPCLWTTGR